MTNGRAISGVSVRRTERGWEMFCYEFSLPGSPRIGYATSPDGIYWTRHASNPIQALGGSVSYVLVNGAFYLMYCGDGRHCWACPL